MCRTRVAADLAATRIRRSYGDYRPWVLYLSAALSQSWFDGIPCSQRQLTRSRKPE